LTRPPTARRESSLLRKLHEGEVEIDEELVRRLVAAQLPQLSDLPFREVRSTGTVNAIFRLGDELCVRLPRLEKYTSSLSKEIAWLPKLSPCLSLRVPEPVARGVPELGYPFAWALYRWIDGDPYRDDLIEDESIAAEQLARFVIELRRVDRAGAPRAGRRPLRELDSPTRNALAALDATIDRDAALAAWEAALEAKVWDGDAVWIHTDLLRPNLLVDRGGLCAVIDFGGVGIGDPAADLIPAWSVFGPTGRDVFRQHLGSDEGAWRRARGYALHQAAMIIPYYAETNPDFVTLAQRTIREILADGGV
jgi:aminoglycoside phosphotransferase (APT) family kinase protein